MSEQTLPGKYAAEKITVTFDFADELPAGDSLASAFVTCTLLADFDAAPSARLDGAAQISGGVVLQRIQGGTPGARYVLQCNATLSVSGAVLVRAGILPIRRHPS
jgi:hypothetical protein